MSQRVLLVGWDAAEWKFITPLLDSGRLPNLSRLVDGGAMGNLASLKPCLSPILWTSLATGKTADKHGITGFIEPTPDRSDVRLASSTSRTAKALWNILSQSGKKSIVVDWFASHPAEPIQGVTISNRFFEGLPNDPNQPWNVVPGSVHPPSLAASLSPLRMHPAELAREDLTRLIPSINAIDCTRDPRPAKLAEMLARTVSVHSVATALLEAEPWDLFAVYYGGLDVAGHEFMPYHPPRLPNVSEADFEAYQSVMTEMYLFHDAMLGRLLELAGPEVTVVLVSDHGFHSNHLRPLVTGNTEEALAAAWHRPYGIVVLHGPPILKDERIYGATLLDIAPTVLTLFELPVGRDMDGRPLLQAFTNPPHQLRSIASWEERPGDDGRHPATLQQAVYESTAMVEQLVAMGYLPAATAESRKAVATADAESRFNLAIVHSCHGREQTAHELLQGLHTEQPEQLRYAVALAKSYANLGNHQACLHVIESLEAKGWASPEGHLLAAASLFNLGHADRAQARIDAFLERGSPGAHLLSLVGNLHLAGGRWQAAADAFDRALAQDDDDAHAHAGRAHAALKLEDYEAAAEHALRAVGLIYFFPQAHTTLGLAFKGMGEIERAKTCFETVLKQAPNDFDARHELTFLK